VNIFAEQTSFNRALMLSTILQTR